MTQKIQTNELQRIEATSADNVMMHTDATVVWKITNVYAAAKFSAETMRQDGASNDSTMGHSDIDKLRNDVLKQATASLASFIGEIRYSDSFHISAAGSNVFTAQPSGTVATGMPTDPEAQQVAEQVVPEDESGQDRNAMCSAIFDGARMSSALEAANVITITYGVEVLSINIISAIPADPALQQALAKGAVASADAERAETVAKGEAKAALTRARAEAEGEKIRAEGAKLAADMISSNPLAVELAKINSVGTAIQGSGTSTLFFGADAASLSGLMSNPAVLRPGSNSTE